MSSRWATQEYDLIGGHAMIPAGHTAVATILSKGIRIMLSDAATSIARIDGAASWDDDGAAACDAHVVEVLTRSGA